jgi:hypothetical protein
MHVSSHISNSQGYFSAHEMPIWSRSDADFPAAVHAKPRVARALPPDGRVFRCSSLPGNPSQKRPPEGGRYKVYSVCPETIFRNLSNPTEVKNENLQY